MSAKYRHDEKRRDLVMINAFLRFKTQNEYSSVIKLEDIQKSKKVLFALFTRYGDTIIDIVIIKEFVEHYPSKDYLVLCPKQMKPYFEEIAPKLKCIGINKRNFFDIFKLNLLLKKWKPDIGFNPWSFGDEGFFFLSYCKKYQLYKNFEKPRDINHYEVVREYLKLPKKTWKAENLNINFNLKRVLICPESTDNDRSISTEQIDKILDEFKLNFGNPNVTIASMSSKYLHHNCNNFFFKKNEKSSRSFIKLVKESHLVVCADSAPLHIANAFNKNIVAIFNTTSPKIVMNTGSKFSTFTD